MDDEQTICLTEYPFEDFDKIKGWDGFVTPSGGFLKIIKRDSIGVAHDNFVEVYALNILKQDINKISDLIKSEYSLYNINPSLKDVFIDWYGNVNYEYLGENTIDLCAPNYHVNKRKVTNSQIIAIRELIKINGDNPKDLDQILQLVPVHHKTRQKMRKV